MDEMLTPFPFLGHGGGGKVALESDAWRVTACNPGIRTTCAQEDSIAKSGERQSRHSQGFAEPEITQVMGFELMTTL